MRQVPFSWKRVTACLPLAQGEREGAELRCQLDRMGLGGQTWGAPGLSGRGAQLNALACRASTPWLWFLHADSRLDAHALDALHASAHADPGALHYFRLSFGADGPALAKFNAAAANWRSRLLGLPFGDQGFLLPRAAFLRAGGFDERLPLGEDLDFVVRARLRGLRLREVPAKILSSARTYARRGWAVTTASHVWHTACLALQAAWRARHRSPSGGFALAAFVKTPGLSPVKSRLAVEIGARRARRFYEASLDLLRELLAEAGRSGLCEPIWNVAEPEGLRDRRWSGLPRRLSGRGNLEERLHQSYAELLVRHGAVCFIGADSPQMSLRHLLWAYAALGRADFALLPARDGGYALFAGRKELPQAVWLEAPLSRADTAKRFASGLRRHGSLEFLPELCDLDRSGDLPEVLEELAQSAATAFTPAQRRLARAFQALRS